MEWYESKKPYIFFGIAIPAAVTVAVFLITEGILPRILTAILSFVCIPLIVLSLYMYAVGTGDKWINGINWRELSEEETKAVTRYISKWIAIGTAVLLLTVGLILYNLIIGIIGIVVSVIIMLVPVFLYKKKMKELLQMKVTSNKMIAAFTLTMLVSVAFAGVMVSDINGMGYDSVTVSLNETSFSVKAPMFDHTFEYSEISDLTYHLNFERGNRVAGYGGLILSTGTWEGGTLGVRYELASYADINQMISFKCNGELFAINQNSSGSTQELYEYLLSKVL